MRQFTERKEKIFITHGVGVFLENSQLCLPAIRTSEPEWCSCVQLGSQGGIQFSMKFFVKFSGGLSAGETGI